MPPNTALQRIIDQERILKLWHRRPHGYPIWHIRRLGAYRRELTGGSAAMPKAKLSQTEIWVRDARLLGESIVDLFSALPQTAAGDVLLFTSSTYRRKRADGTAPCIFATHLEEQLGRKLRVFEIDGGNIPRDSRPSNVASINLGFRPSYRFVKQAARLDAKLRPTAYAEDKSAFAAVGEREALALSLQSRLILELATRWFRRRRPPAVFVLCAYSSFAPIQLAAKRLGIPVIELQHGVIHESHPGYIFPRFTEAEFAQLPVPDHLIVFGRYFGELLDENSEYFRGRWSVGGHPWLKETLRSAPALAAAAPDVCFFSQCEAPVRERIRACARELVRASPGVSIGIKPHPGEQDARDYYREATDEGVHLYGRGEDSYALLKGTKMAVCVHSTVVIEALAFSCMAVAIESEAWTEAIHALVAAGRIHRATSGADLARLLSELKLETEVSDAEEMFAIGAPAPDFEQLIARVTERVKPRRP